MTTERTRDLTVAVVGPLPPPSGGMANQTRQLALLLEQEGIQAEVVRVNSPYRPRWVGRIRGVRALFRLFPYLAHLWSVAGRVDLFHIMANSGWSWHLFAAPAVWIARLRGKAVVVNYRGGEAEAFLRRSIAQVRPTLRRANVIIVPSAFLERIFAACNFATRIVPNIVDLARFAPNHLRRMDPAAPHVVVARNLEVLYDNTTALRAFRMVHDAIPGARLTIAGSGPERTKLEAAARDLGLADVVAFAGRVDNEEMPGLYQDADLVLNPSLADNMPISILEALASGVPVVSTNVGGVPSLVEDGRTALLVPPRSPETMAEAALRVLRDEPLRNRLVQAGLDHARGFDWNRVRHVLLSAYQIALDGATAAGGRKEG
jgi:glycosyltransferase involved in cell wall biosynthesis